MDPSKPLKRRRSSEPMKVTAEIRYVDPKDAPTLARQQTEAIMEVLQWIADNRPPDQASPRPETG